MYSVVALLHMLEYPRILPSHRTAKIPLCKNTYPGFTPTEQTGSSLVQTCHCVKSHVPTCQLHWSTNGHSGGMIGHKEWIPPKSGPKKKWGAIGGWVGNGDLAHSVEFSNFLIFHFFFFLFLNFSFYYFFIFQELYGI